MTKKRRKTLDDALAEQFVYGGDEPKAEQPPVSEEPEPIQNEQPSIQNPKSFIQNKELSLMEKLQVQPKEVTKRFTVDLPESMHRKLSILAARTGRTKADIVRLLLQDALKDVED